MSAAGAAFGYRGVVEGFYGTPWSHADRLWLIERIGAWGMNTYVYAPKEDPLHRDRWREPYPEPARAELRELVERGAKAGVRVGFAVAPGLSIRYAARDDVAALAEKLRGFQALGARLLSLALDDVPTHLTHAGDRAAFPSLAAAHVALAHAVREALGSDTHLWLVPTDYLAAEPTAYLEEMGARLDPAIEVGWTGRTIVSPTIRADEARQRAATLRRKLLLWDNVPVADGPMRPMLHLGPYLGRDPALAEHANGVLLNPMQHAHASGVMLHTAAAWLRDPAGTDPEAAWQAALDELGAGAPAAFACFARAHRFSALAPDDRDTELEAAWTEARSKLDADSDPRPALAALREQLEARAGVADTLRAELADRALAAEIEPWLAAHGAETQRMLAATALLETLAGDAPRLARTLAFLAFQGRLTRIPTPPVASYGPRRVVYPQLVSMHDDGAGFGADPALFRDRCLADEIVRVAEERALAALRV